MSAGQLSDDCSLHVADAVAVNRLMKSLKSQTQLEAIEVAFGGPVFSDLHLSEHYLDNEDINEQVILDEQWRRQLDYHDVSEITAQMFLPAWSSICKLMENSQIFKLRYGSLAVVLPGCRSSQKPGDPQSPYSPRFVHNDSHHVTL